MEWTEALKSSVSYMEEHLLEELHAEDVARQVNMSEYYFQKGFSLVTGYTIGEYIRNRRLYLAALELLAGTDKVIDIAYKYGYETPESFSKAFKRFHGVGPAQIKSKPSYIQPFQPLVIKLSVEGGRKMDVRFEKMDSFQIVGKKKEFTSDNGYLEIPKYWCEWYKDSEKEMKDSGSNTCGKYGICISKGGKNFDYYIAGDYQGTPAENGYQVVEIPAHNWAKFRCVGPLPGAFQSVNTRIFSEWLPGNDKYEIDDTTGPINVEMYTEGDMSATDYVCEIWIPVREK